MTEYKLNLARLTIEFEGVETRNLNIELFRGDEFLDCVVLAAEDVLWLLGSQDGPDKN